MSRKSQRNAPVKRAGGAPDKAAPTPQQQQGTLRQIAVQQQSWHGPLPSPEQLARFNQVLPGCAERIVRMAEQEGEHSREVQMRAVKGTVRGQYIGQFSALAVAAGCLVASYNLAMSGHDAVAGILGGGTLTTVVLAFLNRKKEA